MGKFEENMAIDDLFDDILEQEIDRGVTETIIGEGYDQLDIWEDGTPPVSIEEFIDSPEYLNLGSHVFPVIRENLSHVVDPKYRESFMLTSKGSGKTTTAQIFMAYNVYRLLKLRDPQRYYGLIPGTQIAVILVSVSEKQAKNVGFAGLKNLLDNSPWFKDKYEPLSLEVKFNKNITVFCGHSGSTAFLGFNTICAVMDEVDWMMATGSGRSVAAELYRALRGSLNTRYPNDFKLLAISSPKDEFSFLYNKFKQTAEKGKFISIPYEHPVFDEGHYGIPDHIFTQIADLGVEAYEDDDKYAFKGPSWIINPKTPLSSLADEFIHDEVGALRDYAAIPLSSNSPFFQNPSIIDRNADPMMQCPIDENLNIAEWFVPETAGRYFFGADLSVRGDATGIALLHANYELQKVVVDFSKQLKSYGARIDYKPIMQLIYNLQNRGFNIVEIDFDQFQSNYVIMELRSRGFKAEQVNYGDSFVGLTQLHEFISTGKLVYGTCNDVFIGECKELQVVNSRRIDHLGGHTGSASGKYNSKDCVDAVTNALLPCIQDMYRYAEELQDKKTAAQVVNRMLETNFVPGRIPGVSNTFMDDIRFNL